MLGCRLLPAPRACRSAAQPCDCAALLPRLSFLQPPTVCPMQGTGSQPSLWLRCASSAPTPTCCCSNATWVSPLRLLLLKCDMGEPAAPAFPAVAGLPARRRGGGGGGGAPHLVACASSVRGAAHGPRRRCTAAPLPPSARSQVRHALLPRSLPRRRPLFSVGALRSPQGAGSGVCFSPQGACMGSRFGCCAACPMPLWVGGPCPSAWLGRAPRAHALTDTGFGRPGVHPWGAQLTTAAPGAPPAMPHCMPRCPMSEPQVLGMQGTPLLPSGPAEPAAAAAAPSGTQ